MAETTAEKLPAHLNPNVQFKPGQSGNPAGRPKGARNKLGEAFIQALHDDFTENGVEAVQKVRAEKPDQYLKVIASLLPSEHRLTINDQFSEMSDDELAQRVRTLTATLAPFLVDGAGDAIEGAGSAKGKAKPSRIH